MPEYYDKETDIWTHYDSWIEGIQVKFNDRWCPGATISLYKRSSWTLGGSKLLHTKVDCPKELLWTPATPEFLFDGVEIGYWADGYMRYEMLATEEELDEIAARAVYDELAEAHIAVTHELSVGTSTVWLKAKRYQGYRSFLDVDVHFCVEFANPEECTRFLHEDMRKLEHRVIYRNSSDLGVIDVIIRALHSMSDDHFSARNNAILRRIPCSQFLNEYPQPDTQVIRRRGSNGGDDRPCFLTLHLSIEDLFYIIRVDWSGTNSPSTVPSPPGAFRSLNNLHLKSPSHASQDDNLSHQGDLTITISAREISFSTSTDSVSLGNGFTLNSEHRTVTVNYINAIMGDAFLGPISRSNVGGTNNVNNIRTLSPVGSRSPRLTWSLPRPHMSTPRGGDDGVAMWVDTMTLSG